MNDIFYKFLDKFNRYHLEVNYEKKFKDNFKKILVVLNVKRDKIFFQYYDTYFKTKSPHH